MAFVGTINSDVHFRNRIINGDMRIDQRNAGANSKPIGDGYDMVDRYRTVYTGGSKFTVGQNLDSISTLPPGFINCLGLKPSGNAVSSSDYNTIVQKIEGTNVDDLGWGTANAKTVTLSFWVRSSNTGTFGGAITNNAVNRSYPFTYTINTANNWEYETITIPGDTTGTWLSNNSTGMQVYWSLGTGSTFSGTANTWAANNFYSATSATNIMGNSTNTWYLTGVQLEPGSTATPFEHRPPGMELELCQRYYIKSFRDSTVPANGQYTYYSGTFWEGSDNGKNEYIYFPVSMRASPSFILYGDSGRWQVFNGGSWVTSTTTIAGGITERGFTVFIVGNISNSSLHPWYCKGDWVATAEL
jgi:hypothetical protein